MSNYTIVNGNLYHSDELMHYGVKGMKWGVIKANRQIRKSKEYKQDEKKTTST